MAEHLGQVAVVDGRAQSPLGDCGAPLLRVLMVEDAEADAELVLGELRRGGYEILSERVDTAGALRLALQRSSWDLITCDWVLPRLEPTEALDVIRQSGAEIPVIIISGQVGEEVAVSALKSGAHDYINKHSLTRLLPAVERELRECRERASRRRAEEALRRSEKRFSELADHIHEVFWVRETSDFRVSYVNAAYERIFGRSVERLYADPREWALAIHPEDRDTVIARMKDQLRTGYEMVYRIVRPDGTERWVRDQAVPILDDSGRVCRIAGNVEDVTEHMLARESMKGLQRLLKLTLDSLSTPIAILDHSGTIIRVNHAWREFGSRNGLTSPSDGLNMNYLDVCDAARGDDSELAFEAAAGVRALLSGRSKRFSLKYPCHGPKVQRWFMLRGAAFLDGSKFVAVAHEDISKTVEAEETLRSLNVRLEDEIRRRTQELEASVKSLETFAEFVGHDLRAPLRAINGFTQVVRDDCDQLLDEQSRDYLGRVQKAGAHMESLLEGLLRLARISHGEMRRESIDLSEVVRDVATERLRLEPERQVSFAIEDGVGARGDRTLIRTVVGNFVGNALKFTRSRPLDACIEFGLLKESMGTRTYFIRDNGVGFESNRNSEMFKAFRRLHGSNEFEGEGIGLAIVDRIISRHGGSVWAQGEVGAGATFYFTLGSEDSVG